MSTIPVDRRTFLRRGAGVAGGVAAAGPLSALMARAAVAQPVNEDDPSSRGKSPGLFAPDNGGYGPLQPAGDELALPAGFSYVAFGRTGTPMSDGVPTPSAHDGMAAFPAVFVGAPGRGRKGGPKGKKRPRPGDDGRQPVVTLVRNHERGAGAAFADPNYDPLAGGGTTTLLFDTDRMELVEDYASIAGHIRNCAGGPTPWGSWLTCEETTVGLAAGLTKPHGYIFDVPFEATEPVEPVALKAMGRLVHEAVAVDPATGVVYETEDRGSSGFYRFLPDVAGELAEGGVLQMLAVRGQPQYDTRTGQRVGARLPVEWVTIAEPDPATAEANPSAVFNQGRAGGGATFARLEGAWYGNGSVFFTATSGGDATAGQVWQFKPKGGPRGRDSGDLTLLFESPSRDVLDAPDNIVVSPSGSVLLCEDGGGEQFLRGVTRRGQIFDFGLNILNGAEFAGACFSPDGRVLFVNIQSPGITFAITGPFERGQL